MPTGRDITLYLLDDTVKFFLSMLLVVFECNDIILRVTSCCGGVMVYLWFQGEAGKAAAEK